MASSSSQNMKATGSQQGYGLRSKKTTNISPVPPAMKLCLSSLIWKGAPYLYFCPRNREPLEVKEYGRYGESETMSLIESGWSSELMAHIFKPKNPYQFEYKREKFFGISDWNDADLLRLWADPDPDPLFFLHRQDNLIPFDLRGLGTVYNTGNGWSKNTGRPPFIYMGGMPDPGRGCTSDWSIPIPPDPHGAFEGGPEITPILRLSMPDLQLHSECNDPDPGGEDSDEDTTEDSMKSKGFKGTWVNNFIKLVRERAPLGVLEKTVWAIKNKEWGSKDPDERMWAVKVRLEPVPGSVELERDDEDWYKNPPKHRKVRLVKYCIRATVSEVYVKPEFIKEFLEGMQSDDEDEDEDE